MLQVRHFLVIFLWITNARNVSLHTNGIRKLDMQFDNITYMDLLSRSAMRRMHDELDNDDDGNVSISEGVKFFAGHKDLLENTGANANLPGFVTDIDGRITEAEFWDSWIQSNVHNWTNAEMLSWLKYECELPQYSLNFQTVNVTGAAFPILASNSSIVSILVDGSKENRIKLMLKAKEVVLFGPPKQKGNLVKDALLTFSLALALGGIAFGMHVQRKARDTIENIEEKMLALQRTMDHMEEESAIDMIPVGPIRPQEMDERSGGSNSGESEDSLTSASMIDGTIANTKLAEVMRELDATKEALRNAGKMPNELVKLLKTTHQVESKLFQMKKDKVYKDVEQTKSQFQKIERNRSSLFGILQVVHGRQMDTFDFQVQQTRDEFRELQTIMEERRKRWASIEQLCNFRIKASNSRGNPAKGRSSKMTVDQDILLNLDSMSVISASSQIDKSLSMMQKQRTNKTKRTSLPSTTDDEERDVVSLKDFSSLHQKKSPTSTKKFGTMPSHMSSPALTTKVNGVAAHGHKDPKKLPHSESTGQLESSSIQLTIPETGNQTFPKRSPHNIRKREKLPASMLLENNDSVTTVSTDSLSSSPSANIPRSKTSELIKSVTLSPSKRSASTVSLQNCKSKETSDNDLSPTSFSTLIIDEAINNNGTKNLTKSSSPLSKSPQSVEKVRKSNIFKRAFYKKKQK
uniref:stromal interaction molecule homolog isoform X1 n=1 Tax=Styela clava TaxID=7725 RepID=UPI001939DD43|nr:stromal interaction molecule homolog isoform X1 [Styela clava]